MRNLNLLGMAALTVAFLVGAVACGSPTDAPDARTTLEVASFPAADVWIDGDWKGSTPISISVEPGSHDLTLRQSGFAEVTQTVQIEAGGHAKVDEVLIAQDLDDPEVVRLLARAFDVDVEPFQAPETHRGGRKAPTAILLWPHQDVRPEGLDTFAIEVSEEYDGDGYLVFRKGRKILYKEPFDPDAMTTVSTIPLDVLSEVDVGDKVTWGLMFDSRRQKSIEGRFRVVTRPKADKRLEKIARDRHLARQPALTRAMVKAKALENYRLYTEALVAYLEIAQDNKTSMQPYQGIVTTLRRLDAKDSRLWQISSQFVAGSGRGRTGRTGIAAFAPQGARPLSVPAPTAPSLAGEARRPGPGDQVPPGLNPVPGAETPTAPTPPPSGDTPETTTPRGPEAAALLERAQGLNLAAGEAKMRADEARQLSEVASTQAEHATEHAAETEARLQQAQGAAEEAERAQAEDPTPENQARLEAAREELGDAQVRRDDAAEAAADARQRADEAMQTAEEAAREAGELEGRAAEARRELEASGLRLPGQEGPPSTEAPTPPGAEHRDATREMMERRVTEAQGHLREAERAVEDAQEAVRAAPGDPGAAERLREAEAKLSEVQAEVAQLDSELRGEDPEPGSDE